MSVGLTVFLGIHFISFGLFPSAPLAGLESLPVNSTFFLSCLIGYLGKVGFFLSTIFLCLHPSAWGDWLCVGIYLFAYGCFYVKLVYFTYKRAMKYDCRSEGSMGALDIHLFPSSREDWEYGRLLLSLEFGPRFREHHS